MANGKLLRTLVKSARDGNERSFVEVVEKVIEEERQKQHHLLANDLERILTGRSEHMRLPRLVPNLEVPKDKESGLPLLEIREPTKSLRDVILSHNTLMGVERIILEQNKKDLLRSYGLKPINKALFYGPPGCGKTISAELIANELNLPLVVIRLDSVVSSYLGQTALNLRKVFDFIAVGQYVVLFDEFDALGKERALANDHGELKRVVNAFLQMLDSFSGESILIAATNHESLLDSAIWRRFEMTLEFVKPSPKQIPEILKSKLRAVRRDFEIDDKEIVNIFNKKSHSDIERVLILAIKNMILEGKEFLTEKHIKDVVSLEATQYSHA